LEKVEKVLLNSETARTAILNEEEELAIKSLGLLARKKIFYAANVQDSKLGSGNELMERLKVMASADGSKVVV
jgi:ribosome-binding ATPase YchF (GTP1/OBG family)